MQKKKFFNTRDLVAASLLIALSIVFARMFSIRVSDALRLSFADTPIILAGILLGPWWGLLVGALADLVGFMVAPMGAYIPGLTITSALVGFIPGILYKYVFKKRLTLAIIVAVIIDMIVVNGLLKTYILALVFSFRTFSGWLAARMPVEAVMTVIHSVVTILLVKALRPVFNRDRVNKIKEAADTESETSQMVE